MLETHPCAADGCRAACPTSHFMCVAHWRMVPAPLQRLVRDAYRAWRRSVSIRRDVHVIAARARLLRSAQEQAEAAVREKLMKRSRKQQEGQPPLF